MGWMYSLNELAEILGLDDRDIGADSAALLRTFDGISTDTRTLEPGEVFFALRGETFDGNDFVTQAFRGGAIAAVTTLRNPDGPCLVVRSPVHALQAFAGYHRALHRVPVIAITGSCGKTTAKDMTAAVLGTRYRVVKTQGNLNNDIGCPLSLLRIDDRTEAAVIEIGANHAGEILSICGYAAPTEAVVTMVAPAHLEGFGSIDQVADAKAEIMASLPRSGVFYVNNDDMRCVRMGQRFPGETVRFGTGGDVALEGIELRDSGEMAIDIAPAGRIQLPLFSRAHVTNVLVAVAVGLRHGVTEFEGPLRAVCASSARLKVFELGPLRIIDDTYNANPASVAAALRALADRTEPGRRIAVLGDMLELGPMAEELHYEAGRLAGELGVTALFARGANACDTIRGARASGVHTAEALEDHDGLAAAVRAVANPGDTVLVKGSRGMEMERVIDALRPLYPQEI